MKNDWLLAVSVTLPLQPQALSERYIYTRCANGLPTFAHHHSLIFILYTLPQQICTASAIHRYYCYYYTITTIPALVYTTS